MHASCNHRLAIAINSIKYDINKVKLATAFPQQCLALSLDWEGGDTDIRFQVRSL